MKRHIPFFSLTFPLVHGLAIATGATAMAQASLPPETPVAESNVPSGDATTAEPVETPAATEQPLPLQEPIPPPPQRYDGTSNRHNRLIDVGSDLSTLIARDGNFGQRPRFGGPADTMILRGATGPAGSDLTFVLDDSPLGVPFAGRGVGYTDLNLLPVSAIGSYVTNAGPFDGSHAGTVRLSTRHLHGVDAEVLIGDRGTRRLSLAAGSIGESGESLLAIESRHATAQAGVSDDRAVMLGRVSHKLNDDTSIALTLRFYRDVWDDPGMAPRSDVDVLLRNQTDGGELMGLGGAIDFNWTPSTATRLRLNVGYLDDRFSRYETTIDFAQQEKRDRDRVAFAKGELSIKPVWKLPTRLSLIADAAFDQARTRDFATASRQRTTPLGNIDSDWLRLGAQSTAEIELVDNFTLGAFARADQLTIRRNDDNAIDTRDTLLPSAAVWFAYERETFGTRLHAGQGHRTAANAVRTTAIATDAHSVDLSLYGDVEINSGWRLTWRTSGFLTVLESGLLSPDPRGSERSVWGAEASIDLEHTPSSLILVARGGPLFSSIDAPGDESDGARVAEVPSYVAHVGLLTPKQRGLCAEVWIDLYGDYALTAASNASTADSIADISARVGYRTFWGTVWLGGTNLLDADDAADTPTPEYVVPKTGLSAFIMLDIEV